MANGVLRVEYLKIHPTGLQQPRTFSTLGSAAKGTFRSLRLHRYRRCDHWFVIRIMPPRQRGQSAKGKDAAAEAPSWKRAAGSAFSAKAKKEYLQWKRQQKREQGQEDSDEEDAPREHDIHDEIATAVKKSVTAPRQPAGQQRPAASGAGPRSPASDEEEGAEEGVGRSQPEAAAQRPKQRGRRQTVLARSTPLQYASFVELKGEGALNAGPGRNQHCKCVLSVLQSVMLSVCTYRSGALQRNCHQLEPGCSCMLSLSSRIP